MQLGVFNPVLYSMSLEESLKYLNSLGVTAMEFGCGGSPGTAHGDAKELVKSDKKVKELKALFEKYNITVSAISVHGNPVHPNKAVAELANADFEAGCVLAGKLGVSRVVTFSGCPGDRTSEYPNWVTCPWPNDFPELLQYQWEEVLIPYWKKAAAFAENAGVKHVCFEMHPGFCVYNPTTMMKIREAVGPTLCANFDPSHLIWQGVDLVAAIKYLGPALQYFHAKDTALIASNKSVNGVLDPSSFTDESCRAWLFRTVGYGSSAELWKDMMSALRMIGYDHVISIEHEDSLMTPKEGLEKAVKFLKEVMIFDSNKTELWWA